MGEPVAVKVCWLWRMRKQDVVFTGMEHEMKYGSVCLECEAGEGLMGAEESRDTIARCSDLSRWIVQ